MSKNQSNEIKQYKKNLQNPAPSAQAIKKGSESTPNVSATNRQGKETVKNSAPATPLLSVIFVLFQVAVVTMLVLGVTEIVGTKINAFALLTIFNDISVSFVAIYRLVAKCLLIALSLFFALVTIINIFRTLANIAKLGSKKQPNNDLYFARIHKFTKNCCFFSYFILVTSFLVGGTVTIEGIVCLAIGCAMHALSAMFISSKKKEGEDQKKQSAFGIFVTAILDIAIVALLVIALINALQPSVNDFINAILLAFNGGINALFRDPLSAVIGIYNYMIEPLALIFFVYFLLFTVSGTIKTDMGVNKRAKKKAIILFIFFLILLTIKCVLFVLDAQYTAFDIDVVKEVIKGVGIEFFIVLIAMLGSMIGLILRRTDGGEERELAKKENVDPDKTKNLTPDGHMPPYGNPNGYAPPYGPNPYGYGNPYGGYPNCPYVNPNGYGNPYGQNPYGGNPYGYGNPNNPYGNPNNPYGNPNGYGTPCEPNPYDSANPQDVPLKKRKDKKNKNQHW